MKILVDKIPEDKFDCLFSVRNHCTGDWTCRVNGMACVLAVTHECPYLAEIKSEV